MAGFAGPIEWDDINTAQTLGTEFIDDIRRITKKYNPYSDWIRQNGQEISMVNMDNNHIINALRLCKRNLRDAMTGTSRYELLLLEAIHRGLMNKDVGEWDAEENSI